MDNKHSEPEQSKTEGTQINVEATTGKLIVRNAEGTRTDEKNTQPKVGANFEKLRQGRRKVTEHASDWAGQSHGDKSGMVETTWAKPKDALLGEIYLCRSLTQRTVASVEFCYIM
jgi:hypothetical protein